jgi:hypothetical protein
MAIPSEGFACATAGDSVVSIARAVTPTSNDRTMRIM